jgi:hypothetical protein
MSWNGRGAFIARHDAEEGHGDCSAEIDVVDPWRGQHIPDPTDIAVDLQVKIEIQSVNDEAQYAPGSIQGGSVDLVLLEADPERVRDRHCLGQADGPQHPPTTQRQRSHTSRFIAVQKSFESERATSRKGQNRCRFSFLAAQLRGSLGK